MRTPLIVLVSTIHSVLAVDVHTGRYEVVDRGHGLYYGIARSPEGPLVATRRQGIAECGRPSAAGVILRLGSATRPAIPIEPPIPLRDVHQLIEYEGRWFVVCSRDEKVVVTMDGEWCEWYPIAGSTTDEHHVNSIVVVDDNVHVLAHNWEAPSEIHHYRWPAGGPSVDRGGSSARIELERLGSTQLGREAHNIWLEGDCMKVCSSAEGLILSSDGTTRRVGGYPRGLAVTPTRIVVGRSLDAPRGERARADAELAVYDREWRHLRDIILPGEGMAHDVRVPGVSDECDPGHDDEPLRFTARGGWHRLPVRTP